MSSEISRRRPTHRPAHTSSPSHRRRNPPITPRKLRNRSLLSDISLDQSSTHSHNVFSEILPILSPRSTLAYPEDSRVLVSVTVEGSLGPIRTLMKLSSSVEEAIKLTIDEYVKEGRVPQLQTTASLYELHLSSFTFESLDRSETIGSIGSRVFYLRKRAATSEFSCADEQKMSDDLQPCPFMALFPSNICRGIAVILRRMRSVWKMLGCLHC